MRSEFPTSVRVTVIKSATRENGQIYCDQCHLPCKKFQVDHIIADAHGGKNTRENAQLLCEVCYNIKNPKDTTIAAKIKRQEAQELRAEPPKAKIANRPREPKPKRDQLPIPPRRDIFSREIVK